MEEHDIDEEVNLLSLESLTPAKKRRCTAGPSNRLGGIESRQFMSALPKGPETLDELMDWPSQLLRCVERASGGLFDRLKKVLGRPVLVTSAYSGIDAPRESLCQLGRALQAEYGQDVTFQFCHATDKATGPQTVLRYLAEKVDAGESCVFSELEERLSLEMREILDGMMPVDGQSSEEKELAYADMHQYLFRNCVRLFNPLTTSQCLVHGRECRTSVPEGDRDAEGLPVPLLLHFAGTTCTGWSSAGKQERFTHQSERTHAVWLAERVSLALRDAEDICVQECVVNYPTKLKIRDPLWETHIVVTVRAGPEALGWPTSRPRRFSAAINRRRQDWAFISVIFVRDYEYGKCTLGSG